MPRSCLSHAALAACATHAAARSSRPSAHVTPLALHTHAVPPAASTQALHRLHHHLRLGRSLLTVPHPARLARLQQHLVLGLNLTSHTDEALSNPDLGIAIPIDHNAEDRSPYADDGGWSGERLGVGSAAYFLNLYSHASEEDMQEFLPVARLRAKDDMGIRVDVYGTAIGHPDRG